VGFFGFDSPRVHIDFLRVNIASAADLWRPKCSRPLRAALVLLSHGGHSQEWRDECDGKDVFDSHDFFSGNLPLRLRLRRCFAYRASWLLKLASRLGGGTESFGTTMLWRMTLQRRRGKSPLAIESIDDRYCRRAA
jgi:hypothetical protein